MKELRHLCKPEEYDQAMIDLGEEGERKSVELSARYGQYEKKKITADQVRQAIEEMTTFIQAMSDRWTQYVDRSDERRKHYSARFVLATQHRLQNFVSYLQRDLRIRENGK